MLHKRGCDVERCPRCGLQAIGCGCIYAINNMDRRTLETEHPDIYNDGPSAEMLERWNREWGARRLKWTGAWPGVLECQEFDLWCRDLDRETGEPITREEMRLRIMAGTQKGTVRFHVPCRREDAGAHEDLNRLYRVTEWDPEQQRRVLRRSGGA